MTIEFSNSFATTFGEGEAKQLYGPGCIVSRWPARVAMAPISSITHKSHHNLLVMKIHTHPAKEIFEMINGII
jgi:hypothetical protein